MFAEVARILKREQFEFFTPYFSPIPLEEVQKETEIVNV
jgi:hypothetical protein